MPEEVYYSLFAFVWLLFAWLLGKYIRMKGKALKRQVVIGFGALLVFYFLGLVILFIGIMTS